MGLSGFTQARIGGIHGFYSQNRGKMPKYIVSLGTDDGKVLERECDSSDEKSLRETLSREGYYIFSIKKGSSLLASLKSQFTAKGISTKELISFNQELLALTKAGLPIIKSLDAIMERTGEKRFLDALKEVSEAVKGGSSLSDAFERHPQIFPSLYVSTVRAGEKSGDMVFSLKRYIEYLKKMEGVRKKIISASIYPAMLVFVAVGVILFLLSYVVPTFSRIFLEAGSNLPYPTRILISFTTLLKDYFLVLGLLFVSLMVFLSLYSRSEGGRRRLDQFKLSIPFAGAIFTGYAVSKFARTLSTVLGGGIPLVESVRMVSGVLGNKILENKAHNVVRRVEEGGSLTDSVDAEGLMPPLAIKMLGVGEGSGSLEEMLVDIASFYEEEVDSRLSVLTTLIEPVLMLIMGGFVAAIVIAMYLPVFKLAETAG